MNTLVNRVQLIGLPGSDPEIKKMENGSKMARFSLATHESYKNGKGEKVDDTQWHNIIAWSHNAEFAEKYVHKGEKLCLEGRLVSRTYTDKEGATKYFTDVVANDFLLLNHKKSK